jgi:cardiolipin synthase A/B
VAERPRSKPARWGRRVPREWRYKLAPDSARKRPKGLPSLWTRIVRLLWAWWPWAAASVWATATDHWGWAIGTGIAAVVCYLATPTEFPPRYGLDHQFDVDSKAFLATIAGATGVPFAEGNRLDLLNNGDEFYPAMLDAIAKATRSITMEAYIYWAGAIGNEFADAFAAKARDGVRVKILLDAVGSSTIGTDILAQLEAGGCQLAWYNPIHWFSIGRFNHRTHRKSLIIDGRVAFTGGAGIADHWSGHAQDEKHWRDMNIRVEGPAVIPLQTGFAQNWLETTGELVSGDRYYPPIEPTGNLTVQTLMSSPESGASTVRTMYYLSIVCAKQSIWIANPYFLPDEAAIGTLVDAKRRGVDVRVMVSGIRNDNWLARHNSIRLSGPLLESGIEVCEYNHTMLHHKTMVVDGVWSTIGTTNFDNRSFAHNEESNVCVFDRPLAGRLERIFKEDLAGCRKWTYTEWKKRGIVERARGVIASLLQDQA